MNNSIDTENINIDPAIAPGDNFYDYATGGWRKAHPLTGEYARFGMFDLLRENNRDRLNELITRLSENPESKTPGTIAQKVSDLYALGMDADRLNREGGEPIKPYMTQLRERLEKSLFTTLAWLHEGPAGGVLFGCGVSADPGNASINILHVGETGLGMGDRDYYLEESDDNKRIRDGYAIYVKRLMQLVGYSEEEASRVYDNVMQIEIGIAKIKMTREERRNPQLHYNIMRRDELALHWPEIKWEEYFNALNLKPFEMLNVVNPRFFDGLVRLIREISPQQMEDYLMYNIVAESTGVLGDDFTDVSFEFYGRVMSGREEKRPRWKRAMGMADSMLGEAVGQLYVEKYFPEDNKRYMLALVENLRKGLGEHIAKLEWMSEATKAKALEKLAAMRVKIGYPDKWKDYSEIKIDSTKSYLENVLEAARWFIRDNYSKLGQEVDREEWHMTPQTVNAYYSPITNEICFPAGILQPPYFDPTATDAANYGAIGVVIGHEMTHGFDDQGRQFDKEGNLAEWWTAEDAEKFKALTERLVAQFDAVEIAPGVHANGRYTLGENIADQGGLRIAMTAYETSGSDGAVMAEELKDRQRQFYLAYATLWASNIRDEEKLVRTKTDPHSLEELRVNETLKNITPFLESYGIKEGDAMYKAPADRTIVW